VAIKYEELITLLRSHNNIKNLTTRSIGDEIIHRVFVFEINNVEYVIEWWNNISYLMAGVSWDNSVYTSQLTVIFTELDINGFWPHNSKLDLNFSYDGETCAILRLEEYKS